MLINNIKIAFRSLRKNRLFTIINISGLAIGMTATLLIYIWVQNELTFDNYYPNVEQIHRITCQWNGAGEPITINSLPIRVKEMASEQIPEVEELYVIRPDLSNPLISLEDGTVFEEKEFAFISENWLETFDYKIIAGSIESFKKDKYSIALTEKQAEKYFDHTSALGETLELYGKTRTVQLILAQNPSNSSFQFTAYLPLQSFWENQTDYEEDYNSGNYNYITFAKISKNAELDKVTTQFSSLLNKFDESNKNAATIMPMTAVRFNPDFVTNDYFKHQNKSAVYIFTIIGFILLLTAGLNYVNLSTALISKRVKEIGVKKVIGAGFQHIFTQMMAETLVTSLIAFTASIGLVRFLLPRLSTFVDIPLQLDFTKPSVWIALVGLIALSVLIAGVYPALLSANFKPIQLIRGKGTAQKGVTLRKALVITQFAAVLVILISTLAIHQQLQFIQKKDVGYDRSQVIEIRPNLWRDGNMERNFAQFAVFKEKLEAFSEIKGVAVTDAALSNIHNRNSGTLDWEGKAADFAVNVSQFRANEGLLAVFDLKMEDGRWFSKNLSSDENNIILNETAVKRFDIPEPVVGKKSSFHGREGQIIGVVKDFNFGSLHEAIEPLVIWNNKNKDNTILARIQPEQTEAALSKAEALFEDLLPTVFFKYSFIDETYQQMHEAEGKISLLFQIFAGLLIFISCLGLLGLAVFAAEQRQKEIGIRKVLGASFLNIIGLLSKDFLKLLFIALIVASPIAWYFMQSWLSNFAYSIKIQWWFFALAGFVAIAVALLTISIQSVKAALANPIKSLKNE